MRLLPLLTGSTTSIRGGARQRAATAVLLRHGLSTGAGAPIPTPQQQHHQQQEQQQPDSKPVLGVVGVGKMGAAMAANFLRAGVTEEVVVYDRYDRRSVQALAKEGAVAAGSLEEVGSRCGTVVSMLPNDDALMRCVARRALPFNGPTDLPLACTQINQTNHFHSTHIRTHT